MTKPSVQQLAINNSVTIFWAGVAVAVGALGVFITCVFYALSQAAAALPMPNPSLESALDGMIASRSTMVAAGAVGIIFDIIFAVGALMLMIFRLPASLAIERAGWGLLTICLLIFTLVDALSAGVLTQIAISDGATAAFKGFKLLFDTLFVLGTIVFGLGAPAIFISELKAKEPVLSRSLIWTGLVAAFAGLASGLLYFVNVSLPQMIGLSIAVGTLVFLVYGVQIARTALGRQ